MITKLHGFSDDLDAKTMFEFQTTAARFDIMCGSQWLGQIVFPVCPGARYTYGGFKALAVEKRPSLRNKEFKLLPTSQRV